MKIISYYFTHIVLKVIHYNDIERGVLSQLLEMKNSYGVSNNLLMIIVDDN